MRRRLYFMLPSVESARRMMDEMLLARVEERHIHFLAKRGTDLKDLPEASVLQKTDIVHGAELGLVVGGVSGLIGGIIVMMFPPEGISLQLVTVLIAALIGAFFGMWASSLVASSVPNSRLKAFEKNIEEGGVLMMVDVPPRKAKEICDLVTTYHPEATHHGVDPTIPAFP